MTRATISKRSVDGLKATGKQYFLWDSALSGFGVRISPAGVKSYIYQYRIGGRGSQERRTTIGRHGEITPDTARKLAHKLAEQVRSAIDPVDARRKAAKAQAARKASDKELAFDAYCDRYIEKRVKAEKLASHDNIEMVFRLHAIPVLKNTPITAIERRDVVAVLDRIPASSPALRRSTYAILNRMFNWAKGREDIVANPMDGIAAPPSPPSRDRVLSDEELALALRAAGQMELPFGPFYILLLVTGQRRDEVAGLNWNELDRASTMWTLPKERAKNGEANIVPLSALAIAALDKVAGQECAKKRQWPRKGLVFTTTGKTSISGFSRFKARLDALMLGLAQKEAEKAGMDPEEVAVAPWRVHDARRTVATGLQRLGVRFEVTEAVLNHTSGAKAGVAGIYQRYGWGPEKRAALEAWGDHCEALLNAKPDKANVVPFDPAKRAG